MPAHQSVCFHHADQKHRPDRDGEKRLDSTVGIPGINRSSTEPDYAKDTDDVERGHDNAPEIVALSLAVNALTAIAEAWVGNMFASVTLHVIHRLCLRRRLLAVKPYNLHQIALARAFFRYAEKD
jgi:hypothetical protein